MKNYAKFLCKLIFSIFVLIIIILLFDLYNIKLTINYFNGSSCDIKSSSYNCAIKYVNKLKLRNEILFNNGYPSLVNTTDSILYRDLLNIFESGDHHYFENDPYILDKIWFSIKRNTYNQEQLKILYDFIITSNNLFKDKKPFSELRYLSFFQIWENDFEKNKYIKTCSDKICNINYIKNCDYDDDFSLKKFFIVSDNFLDFLKICNIQYIGEKPKNINEKLVYFNTIKKLRRIGILRSNCSIEEILNAEYNENLDDINFLKKIKCER